MQVFPNIHCSHLRAAALLKAATLGAEANPRSSLHHEVPRVREFVRKHFRWCEIFVLLESVGSMSERDRASMSRTLGILHYELDAAGITPNRRKVLYWFDWPVTSEGGPS